MRHNKFNLASSPCLTHTLMHYNFSIQANTMGLHSAHTRKWRNDMALFVRQVSLQDSHISSRHSALVVSYSAGAGWSMPLHLGPPKIAQGHEEEQRTSSGEGSRKQAHLQQHRCLAQQVPRWRLQPATYRHP